MISKTSEFGSIHGRFQPFHNAHLAYALAALKRVDRLYIGLTRSLSEQTISAQLAVHRFEAENNPLTYFQRTQVIRRALLRAGVADNRFEIGPFPIEVPERLQEFWPTELLCYTTVVSAWNQSKIAILTDVGYSVTVLDDLELSGTPVTTGSEIRKLFRNNDSTWSKFVPIGAADCIISEGWTL